MIQDFIELGDMCQTLVLTLAPDLFVVLLLFTLWTGALLTQTPRFESIGVVIVCIYTQCLKLILNQSRVTNPKLTSQFSTKKKILFSFKTNIVAYLMICR